MGINCWKQLFVVLSMAFMGPFQYLIGRLISLSLESREICVENYWGAVTGAELHSHLKVILIYKFAAL